MAPSYKLIDEFVAGSSNDELISTSPYWVVGIVPFANLITYNTDSKDDGDRSFKVDPVAEKDILVLTRQVEQIQVSATKESHVTHMSAALFPHRNFQAEIHSGDWVVACLLNNEEDGQAVAAKMANKEAINDWKSGLKFVGRVDTIRKSFSMSKQGVRTTRYFITCFGFGELDTYLYFQPQASTLPSALEGMKDFGILIQDVVTLDGNSQNKGTTDSNLIIPRIIDAVFGQGAWKDGVQVSDDRAVSPNKKYVIPRTVSDWFGRAGSTYNDLLRTVIGLHHYQAENTQITPTDTSAFQPDGLASTVAYNTFKTSVPVSGWFPPAAPPSQGTAWSFLDSYSNRPLNEMFVSMRIDPNGNILPHLIIRQTPYTSCAAGLMARQYEMQSWAQKYDENLDPVGSETNPSEDKTNADGVDTSAKPDATDFLELPRWDLHINLVLSGNVGTSDAQRQNFVHSSATTAGGPTDDVFNYVSSPPVHDSVDILRSGVRPYFISVASVLTDFQRGPKFYRDIMADQVMGQQMTMSGEITSTGIQSPVAIGDNMQFDGLVYHIEGISHSAGIQYDGSRYFTTTFSLSHGVVDVNDSNASVEEQREQRFPNNPANLDSLAFDQTDITLDY